MIKKILLVDDNESILDAVSMVLEDAGYLVDQTLKGDEVYQKIAKFMPDLILLDVLLSKKDGRDICKKIKANEKTKHIPIIMISAHPNAEKSIKECGAEFFLAKPFETDVLLQTIKQSLV